MTDIVVHAAQKVVLPEWMPAQVASASNAHKLTKAILALATGQLELDPETGYLKNLDEHEDKARATQAAIIEQAIQLLEAMKLEADAATFQLLEAYEVGQLYMFRPGEKLESLEYLLRYKAEGASSFYLSVISRLIRLLPILQERGIASTADFMEIIIGGGLSKVFHLMGELEQAVADGGVDAAREILSDAKDLPKREIHEKYKAHRSRIPPADAWLEDGRLIILLPDERTKNLVLGRLNHAIKIGDRPHE